MFLENDITGGSIPLYQDPHIVGKLNFMKYSEGGKIHEIKIETL